MHIKLLSSERFHSSKTVGLSRNIVRRQTDHIGSARKFPVRTGRYGLVASVLRTDLGVLNVRSIEF